MAEASGWLGGDDVELAGGGVDEEAVDLDEFGEEGVVADHFDGGFDAVGGGGEAGEPGAEVDAGVGESAEGGFVDASFAGLAEDGFVAHAGDAAVVVADDVYFLCAQGVDGDEDGAHDGAEGGGDDGAGDLDEFGVTVFEIHGLG